MARFVFRSILSTIVTMLFVSVLLFWLLEVGSGDITVKILGTFATMEQRASYRLQLGLDQPFLLRYATWLVGNDWWVAGRVGVPLQTVRNESTGENEWWAVVDGQFMRWQLEDGELLALIRQADGSSHKVSGETFWQAATQEEGGDAVFWGLNVNNSAVKWVRGLENRAFVFSMSGMREEGDAPVAYIPLTKGLLRGDFGESLQTGRPVSATLFTRVRNTFVLALLAFVVVMPMSLLLGVIAGINEGRLVDRLISICGLAFTATPEFVMGIFLILLFAIWLKVLPAATVFLSDSDIWDLRLLVLPVLTLTAAELGYIARMTRASMVDVMGSPYIRTAILKGMPYGRVVFRHALRNALMAPITVIMLHVNWLIGGIVVVEVIFGFPGLGRYIFDSAIFGDFNAVEAAAMLLVLIAVGTRLLGDLIYTFLNPRIRYS